MSLEDPWSVGLELVLGVLRQRREAGDFSLRASSVSLDGLRRAGVAPVSSGREGWQEEGAERIDSGRLRPEEVAPVRAEAGAVPARVRSAGFDGAREDKHSGGPSVKRPGGVRPEAFSGDKAEALAALRVEAARCERCPQLARSRFSVVFGEGDPEAELMFVGEAPGADEDAQGKPFVGAAGELLSKMIGTMGLSRERVYIANELKCRPDMPEGVPGNRKPSAEEMERCLPFLKRQIEIVRPRVLVALGATAMQGLLGRSEPIGRLRAQWHDLGGIPVMATYHPSYLLRNQSLTEKRKVWEDLLQVMERLGLPVSERQRGFFLPKQG